MGQNYLPQTIDLQSLFSMHGRLDWRQADRQARVTEVTHDSRKVTPGTVFVATRGTNVDGHQYLTAAAHQGALALVVESTENIPSDYTGAVLEVLNSKWALAELLAHYYARPEEKLISIGITGTNGKTSSSYILEAILNEAHIPCGVMGTINHHFHTHVWPTNLTTPDTETFFKRASEFVQFGAKAFAMEVSSHSLQQKRVPIYFDVALFTNFTRDHLDYHKTMEEYFHSKELLFTEHLKKNADVFAVINNDDSHVRKVHVASHAQMLTFGKTPSDFQFYIVSMTINGTHFTLTEKGTNYTYDSPLIGEYNVYNVVGCIAVARALGIPHSVCQKAIKDFQGVPGRLQKVPDARPFVFVDYAHTPDALEKTIETLRKVSSPSQKIITVFGCGGDRDHGKRPTMGEVASRSSDAVVVTSDNPRSEDPLKIVQDILTGIPEDRKVFTKSEVDRKKAIAMAIAQAQEKDIVLIAGKGHENYQVLKERTIDFDDFKVAQSLISKKVNP
ncbi:MAG: UDP-N-acetylmuramoyl-L-alanyl-D-glutamate--2,6-diaminopimelate ligase [Bdellovibrionaceae bacterium]|nr:UDP-N-acetylmuramoyl-L-alanyl-D-glutamate--2,6-diaminopimelate ligase [Pseudobdellovibrionaceae bacterium]